MKCILPVILALAFLQGCSTAYQSRGFSGGYSETQLDENIFKVSFSGNGYISGHKVADYTLLRSAELTLQDGFKYFAIVDANSNIEHSTYTSPTTYHTTGNVSGTTYNANTTTTGGQTYHFSKPSSSNMIVCYKEKPENIFTYSAEFVFKNITEKYNINHDSR